ERGPATDPGVDLVEHEDGGGAAVIAGGGQRHLEGEHDTGELTAGGGLGDGQVLGAGVRGEQDRDRVPAGGPVGLCGDVHADVRIGHLEVAQLLLDRGGELLRGGGPGSGQGIRELVEGLLAAGERAGGLLPLLGGALEAVEVHGGGAGGFEQGGDVLGGAVGAGEHGAEVADQDGELVEALVRLLDPARGGVDLLGVAGGLRGDVGQLDAQRIQALDERGEGRIGAGGAAQRLRGDREEGRGGGAVVVAD